MLGATPSQPVEPWRVLELRSKPTIVKLGGSVITVKEKTLTPNLTAIRRLAKEIAESHVSPLVIVHGGGSYGHPIAARYGITEGFKDKSRMLGFSKTHNAMISLNMLVIRFLLDQGLPAFSIASSSFIVTKGGRIQFLNKRVLEYAIRLGFIPVLYGDVVLDEDRGFTILSGDQIVSRLAVELNAEKIIVGVDVNGLYTADPKIDPSAQLITCITINDLKRLVGKLGGSRAVDVTGGMMGKIFELITPVMNGIEVFITNASKPNNLYRALKGEKIVGTRIIKG